MKQKLIRKLVWLPIFMVLVGVALFPAANAQAFTFTDAYLKIRLINPSVADTFLSVTGNAQSSKVSCQTPSPGSALPDTITSPGQWIANGPGFIQGQMAMTTSEPIPDFVVDPCVNEGSTGQTVFAGIKYNFDFTINTTNLPNGAYTLTVTAQTTTSQQTLSDTVNFTVQHPGALPKIELSKIQSILNCNGATCQTGDSALVMNLQTQAGTSMRWFYALNGSFITSVAGALAGGSGLSSGSSAAGSFTVLPAKQALIGTYPPGSITEYCTNPSSCETGYQTRTLGIQYTVEAPTVSLNAYLLDGVTPVPPNYRGNQIMLKWGSKNSNTTIPLTAEAPGAKYADASRGAKLAYAAHPPPGSNFGATDPGEGTILSKLVNVVPGINNFNITIRGLSDLDFNPDRTPQDANFATANVSFTVQPPVLSADKSTVTTDNIETDALHVTNGIAGQSAQLWYRKISGAGGDPNGAFTADGVIMCTTDASGACSKTYGPWANTSANIGVWEFYVYVPPQAQSGLQSNTIQINFVPPAVPTVDLKGNGADGPLSISSGSAVQLTWSSTNASSCTASAAPASGTWTGAKALNNTSPGESTGSLTTSTTFTLTCTGAGGSAADSVAVNISGAANYPLNVTKAGTGAGTVASSPVGINCGGACSANFSTGTSVTLTTNPDAGSSFAGWSGEGCLGTGTCTVAMTQTRNVTATFNIVPGTNYTLTLSKAGTGTGTVTSAPAGISCGTTCTTQNATFTSGTSVTLTAAAASGSTFAGWSGGGCSGTGTCIVVMNANTTVTATFNTTASTYTLTVSKNGTGAGTVTSSPAGINCGSTCSASYSSGTVVTLTATPNAGSSFAGWSGDLTGATNPTTITMNANKNVTATFNTAAFTLDAPVQNCSSTGGVSQIYLAWSAVSGATYTVYRDGVLVQNNGSARSWTDSSVTAGTSYSYFIRTNGGLQSNTQAVIAFYCFGNVSVRATNNGAAWPSSGIQALDYTVSNYGSPGYVPLVNASMMTGDITVTYNSGGPGTTFVSITPAATQTLLAGPTAPSLTFTINFTNQAPGSFTLNALTTSCNGGTSQINLSWSAASGAASYNVYRNSALYQSLGNVTSFTDNAVTPGTAYSYWIEAVNPFGTRLSNNQSATATWCRGDITVNAKLNGNVWPSSGTAGLTYILSNSVGNVNGTVVATTQQNLAQDTWTLSYTGGGPAGATYSSITPLTTQTLPGNVAAKPTLTFTINFTSNPPNPPPISTFPAPTPNPNNATCGKLTVNWVDQSTTEDDFYVYRADSTNNNWPAGYTKIATAPTANQAGTGGGQSYQDTPPVTGQSYYYIVTAHNAGGESGVDPSWPVGPTTNLACAANLSGSSKRIAQYKVNAGDAWTPYTNQVLHTGYYIQFQITIVNSGNATAHAITINDTLSNNLTYVGNPKLDKGDGQGPKAIADKVQGQTITFPWPSSADLGDKAAGLPNWVLVFDAQIASSSSQAVDFIQNTAVINYSDTNIPVTVKSPLTPIRTAAPRVPDIKEVAP